MNLDEELKREHELTKKILCGLGALLAVLALASYVTAAQV